MILGTDPQGFSIEGAQENLADGNNWRANADTSYVSYGIQRFKDCKAYTYFGLLLLWDN